MARWWRRPYARIGVGPELPARPAVTVQVDEPGHDGQPGSPAAGDGGVVQRGREVGPGPGERDPLADDHHRTIRHPPRGGQAPSGQQLGRGAGGRGMCHAAMMSDPAATGPKRAGTRGARGESDARHRPGVSERSLTRRSGSGCLGGGHVRHHVTPTPAEEEVAGIRADLIRIESVNYGDGSGPGERKAAEYVAAQLTEVGLEPELVESSPWAGQRHGPPRGQRPVATGPGRARPPGRRTGGRRRLVPGPVRGPRNRTKFRNSPEGIPSEQNSKM